jgi:hypothetical protein
VGNSMTVRKGTVTRSRNEQTGRVGSTLRLPMKYAVRVMIALLLVVLLHAVPLWYGITKERVRIAPPGVPGLMGGAIVPNPTFEIGWLDLSDRMTIMWHRGKGVTCDVVESARSLRLNFDPTVKMIIQQDPSTPKRWSMALELMSDRSTPYDMLTEQAFGFPIRFLFHRRAGFVDSRSYGVHIALPGESDPAGRWDISYGRLLASILLYLVPIWFVYGLYPRARRYLRRRRGCCGECAYSLKGLNTTTCPECGHVNEAMKARTLPRS